MSADPNHWPGMPSQMRRNAVVLGTYALAGGLVTLAGWLTHVPRLTDWVNSGISMFANTALAASCAGMAILIAGTPSRWAKRLAGILGMTVFVIGGATMIQHIFGIDLRIDTLFFREPWGLKAAVAPGRMGPPASVCFTLIGTGLVLLASQRARRFAPWLGILVVFVAMFSLIGYVFGANPLFAAPWTGIAFQTATIVLALGAGIVASVSEFEPARTFGQDSAAGVLARRSLPLIVALCVTLGWLRVKGQAAGIFDTAMGTAMLVLMELILLSALLWWCTGAVANREHAQKRVEEALREAHEQLGDRAVQLEKVVQERTAKLQEMVNELQHVSYGIAHDMRAPLRAMNLFASLLTEKGSATATPSQIQDYGRRIVAAATRLDRLIQDALLYTKVAENEMALRPVDLSKLILELIETYPNLSADQVDISIANGLPVVLGNDGLLTQCFSNLLGNGVKFVAPGVRPEVRVVAEIRNHTARVWVVDNGIGIPKNAQPRLFKMFQKLDAGYEGTGIGLAIVRKVVERMGGKVGVESEPGRGSRFWVELPMADGGKELLANV
jgi:signal transduction histidine kinase